MAEFLPLIGFVFFGLFSPGPNVILLTASGARFGFRPTLPHIIGVAIGVGITAGITGFGVGALILSMPALETVLKVIACLWILWMSYKLWNAKPSVGAKTGDRPFTILEAVLFQWVNPKVWAVALSATAYVAAKPPSTQALALALAFSCINLCVCLFWTYAGTLLSYLLKNETAWTIFLRIMAVGLFVFSLLVFI